MSPGRSPFKGWRPPAEGPALADFQCYQAKDLKNPKFTPASDLPVDDPFGSSSIDVKKPALVCAPAVTDGSPVSDSASLCCYKMKGAKLSPPADVETDDAFGTLQLQVKSPKMFCTVCTRTALP